MPQGPSLNPRATTIPVAPIGPAAAPVTAQELQAAWQSWQTAWQTADTTTLSEAERVQYILMNRARAADLTPLRADMAAAYEKAAQDHADDPLRLGAMANTIALASLQECMAKARIDRPAVLDDAAVKSFLERMGTYRQVREDVVAWAFRTMEQAVAVNPNDVKARAYLFDRVITMMGVVPEYATECTDIGPWVAKLAVLKPKLAALAPDNDPRKARFEISLDDFERTMTTLSQAADDRRAVRDLVQKFRDSWNQKDEKTYGSLFLPGSRTAQILAVKKMEESIAFNQWQLDTEQPYTIWVAGDSAAIEALTRYRDKDGGLHAYQISGLRARKTPDGWRLE
jgi:hypothetical protein